MYVFEKPDPHTGDIFECTDAAQLYLFVQVFHLAKVSPQQLSDSVHKSYLFYTICTPDRWLTSTIIDLALGDLENLLKCELKLHKIQKYLWEIKPKKKMLHIPVCFIKILILPYHQKKIILPSPSHPCLRSQPIMKLFFVISFNNTIFYQFIICISLIALFQIYNIAFDKLVFK